MKFTRQPPPPTSYRDYHRYRSYTRRDFKCVCAHCFRHEGEAGGEEHFVQDHFKPRHLPGVDPADYLNLYWSCGACNGPQNKGSNWPSEEEAERGEGFCDPCHHDPVGTDYVENQDGTLTPLSPKGTYTNRHIRLSVRKSLVELRLHRRRTRERYKTVLYELKQTLISWSVRLENRANREASQACARLAELVDAYESHVNQEPFMCRLEPPPEIPLNLIVDLYGSG